MSWKRQDQVWEINGLSTMEKFVLLALAHYENETTGLCCPSCNSISKDLNTSVRTVRYSLCRLKKLGVISSSILSTAKGIVNSYKFNQIEVSAILARCAPVAGSESNAQCATLAQPSIEAGSAKYDVGSAKYDVGSAKYDRGVVQPLHPNREDITENITENVNTTTTTTTTKPSPPPHPTGGGGDALADESFDAFCDRLYSELRPRYGKVVGDEAGDMFRGAWYITFKLGEFRNKDGLFEECLVENALRAIHSNGGKDDNGCPITDVIEFLKPFVRGEMSCFGFKMLPQADTQESNNAKNAQEAASTPSEPSKRVSALPAEEKRATAAPTRQICEPAKPHQPKDCEFPTFAEIQDRLNAKFGDAYDRAAVLAAYDKLTEAGWKDASGKPVRDPFRYLSAIATAKQAHSQPDLEPYPDDETIRIWVEEDCKNGYYDLAAALAARDRLFADPTLRQNLRSGIRAYIVGAARRADAQETLRLAVG